VNHLLGNRLFFLIGCVEECRLKERVEWTIGQSQKGRLRVGLATMNEFEMQTKFRPPHFLDATVSLLDS